MKQEKIKFKDVIDAGFTEEYAHDNIFYHEFGYIYTITTKQLSKKISLDWTKKSQLCTIIRENKQGEVTGEAPIYNLKHLKETIKLFNK